MKTLKIATALVVLSSSFAFGQEAAVEGQHIPSLTEELTAEQEQAANIAALNDAWSAACTKYVLSEKAQAACDSGEMPKPIKSGERFPNRGVGAEFNTLIRQL